MPIEHAPGIALGAWGGLNATAIAVPGLPAYDGTHVLDLVLAVVIGVVTALVIAVVRRAAGELAGLGRGPRSLPRGSRGLDRGRGARPPTQLTGG